MQSGHMMGEVVEMDLVTLSSVMDESEQTQGGSARYVAFCCSNKGVFLT